METLVAIIAKYWPVILGGLTGLTTLIVQSFLFLKRIWQLEQDIKDVKTQISLSDKQNNVSIDIVRDNLKQITVELKEEVYEVKASNNALIAEIKEELKEIRSDIKQLLMRK